MKSLNKDILAILQGIRDFIHKTVQVEDHSGTRIDTHIVIGFLFTNDNKR